MRFIFSSIFFILFFLSSQAQSHYFQQQLEYRIDVTLDDRQHCLDGFMQLKYVNHSPDTLYYVWFHLWPNAYKNDRTAFSEQMLLNDRSDFYFSKDEDKGYINQLDFRSEGISLEIEQAKKHIDMIRVNLAKPLMPGDSVMVETPFHVQLPYNFSRGGHVKKSYQITQWYPKPAVYDEDGWHPTPYLDQGEFFAEFGSYDVSITLPPSYLLAATGNEVSKEARDTLLTWRFRESGIHDFAWFADKRWIQESDTLLLPSGRIIKAKVFYLPAEKKLWTNSLAYLKNATRIRSQKIGEYPYDVITVVQGPMGFSGGMEYPGITLISSLPDAASVERTIHHEVGHNWFQGILGSDEREHPFLDEGLNNYYDRRFRNELQTSAMGTDKGFIASRKPVDEEAWLTRLQTYRKQDQPIDLSAEKYSALNYNSIVYAKSSLWFEELEKKIGREVFDDAMREYYDAWKFRHPAPEDLYTILRKKNPDVVDVWWRQKDTTGPLQPEQKKSLKPVLYASLQDNVKNHYVGWGPVVGYNLYDGVMPGLLLHNYNLPIPKFHWAVTPMFGIKSGRFSGIGRIGYSWYPEKFFREVEVALSAATFSYDDYEDEFNGRIGQSFYKVSPAVRFILQQEDALSTRKRSFAIRGYFIGEENLQFQTDSTLPEPVVSKHWDNRFLYQMEYGQENTRVLYPYRWNVLFESAKDFGRISFNGNYFFNFRKKGGVDVRWFAGKYFYLGERSVSKELETQRYHLNMSGPVGTEDYTYSNYFLGRSEQSGLGYQQIMRRDGFMKIRTDLLSEEIGRSDNWLAALNFEVDIPDRFNPLSLLPFDIPLKIFTDLGSSATTWDKDASTGKVLFDAGLQVSLFRNALNIYVPLIYSSSYKDYLQSYPGNDFWQRVTFTIDFNNLSPTRLLPQLRL